MRDAISGCRRPPIAEASDLSSHARYRPGRVKGPGAAAANEPRFDWRLRCRDLADGREDKADRTARDRGTLFQEAQMGRYGLSGRASLSASAGISPPCTEAKRLFFDIGVLDIAKFIGFAIFLS